MKADFEKGTKVCSRCKKKLPISDFYNKGKNNEVSCICKKCKLYEDKYKNTFGRIGKARGNNSMMKRDYELEPNELERRNRARIGRKSVKYIENADSCLVWYSGKLDNINSKEYKRAMNIEYMRQFRCAIRGSIGIKQPSEHFLFDFDLEQMLKHNVYEGSGNIRRYITKWWKGTIRHWTVNDGIWRD